MVTEAKVLEEMSVEELESEMQALSELRNELVQRSRYVQGLIDMKLAQAKIATLGTAERTQLIAALGIPSSEAFGVPGG